MENRNHPDYKTFFELSFAKRPAEELYDLDKDPDQLNNIANDPAYEQIREEMSAQLMAELKASGDPRATGAPVLFDQYPYRARYELNTNSKLWLGIQGRKDADTGIPEVEDAKERLAGMKRSGTKCH